MSVEPDRLRRALDALGALLDAVGESVEFAIVGGGALVLSGVHVRPTEDVDVVAQRDGSWRPSSPLPADVTAFVRDVGRAFDLPLKQTGWDHDWLNATVSFLMPDDLPPGFFDRTVVHEFGGLILHVPAPADLITLKVLSATRTGRGSERQKDIQDLVRLAPRGDHLVEALRWVASRRPTDDFWTVRASSLLHDLAAAGLDGAVEAACASLARDGGAS